jgi:hypothetical protein
VACAPLSFRPRPLRPHSDCHIRGSCTMHRALELGEVLDSIFSFLCINHRCDFAALTVLARTCCAFSDRALDLIWADAPPWYMAQRMDADLWIIKKETVDWEDNQRLVSGGCAQSGETGTARR